MKVDVSYTQTIQCLGGATTVCTLYRILRYKPKGKLFNRKHKKSICNSFNVSDGYYFKLVSRELEKSDDELTEDIKKDLRLDTDTVFNKVNKEIENKSRSVEV